MTATLCASLDDRRNPSHAAAQTTDRMQASPDEPCVGRSPAIREILSLVRKIAASDMPVLIQGELGVGKTVVAWEIHRQSRRVAGPFVHVACGALREPELADKLFGEPGRDPAAGQPHQSGGLLQSSAGGTLFLDGVSQLPRWAQVKLLDWLQQRTAEGRDGHRATTPTTRVISASQSDLAAAMGENGFCAGLYYYLNVVRIDIPPLRHRQDDIRALGEHHLALSNAMRDSPAGNPPRHFSEAAWQVLLRYDWPGNALQLGSVVARAVMLAEDPEIGPAQVADLLGSACQAPAAEAVRVPLAGSLKEIEMAIINEVLRRCRGNKAAAARSLRIHRRTLYRLLEESSRVTPCPAVPVTE